MSLTRHQNWFNRSIIPIIIVLFLMWLKDFIHMARNVTKTYKILSSFCLVSYMVNLKRPLFTGITLYVSLAIPVGTDPGFPLPRDQWEFQRWRHSFHDNPGKRSGFFYFHETNHLWFLCAFFCRLFFISPCVLCFQISSKEECSREFSWYLTKLFYSVNWRFINLQIWLQIIGPGLWNKPPYMENGWSVSGATSVNTGWGRKRPIEIRTIQDSIGFVSQPFQV